MYTRFYEALERRFSEEVKHMAESLVSAHTTARQYRDPDLNRSRPKPEGGPWDYVGTADLECQKLIMSILLKHYPACRFIAEEVEGMEKFQTHFLLPSDPINQLEHVFVIDPIDGSEQFGRGACLWSMMLQWIKNGQPVACMVLCPGMNGITIAAAELGKGTIFSEHLLETMSCMELAEVKEGSILSPHQEWIKEMKQGAVAASPRPSVSFCQSIIIEGRFFKLLEAFGPQVSPDMVISSGVALTLVACGKTCAMIHRPLPWYDLAAIVLVKAIDSAKVVLWKFNSEGKPEIVTQPDYFGQTGYIAGHPEIVDWLVELLFQCLKTPAPAALQKSAAAK